METWFLLAAISGLTAGIGGFLSKVSAYHNQDGKFVSGYNVLTNFLLGLTLFLFVGDFSDITFKNSLPGIIGGSVFYITLILRIKALRYVDSTFFFPLVKTFGPLIVIFFSIFLFKESLTNRELFGLILGLIVPLFILHYKNIKDKNIVIGFYLVLICSFLVSIIGYVGKYINLNDIPLIYHIVVFNLVGVLMAFSQLGIKGIKVNKKNLYGFYNGILSGVLYFISGLAFVYSLVDGNLALVFSINSFSFIIPIIFSVIIYKEHINLKKILAIILTVLSLYFMG